MRFRALVLSLGCLMAVTVNALAASKVKSVRLWRAPDNTRLVFDLSGPVQHSVFTLTAPDRLVIDINGATLAAPLKVSTANTPITAMRSAQRTPTDLRVVIDLKKPSPRKASLAPNAQYGNRLVVDLFDNPPTPRRRQRRRQCRHGAGGAGHASQPRSSRRRRRPASATSSW
jgi:N-acetylmuramoyl-L-alanine amidase